MSVALALSDIPASSFSLRFVQGRCRCARAMTVCGIGGAELQGHLQVPEVFSGHIWAC